MIGGAILIDVNDGFPLLLATLVVATSQIVTTATANHPTKRVVTMTTVTNDAACVQTF